MLPARYALLESEVNVTQSRKFEQLVMPHMDAAFNLARWLCGNSHDAEDIAQEAMLRAFRFFDGLRGDDARAWLLKIVRNTYYSEWRRGRGHDDSTEFDEEIHTTLHTRDDPESIHSRMQDVKLLDAALAQLPVEYREALVLREIEDLSYKEIAGMLEIPIGTVMSRIARARRLLQERVMRTEIKARPRTSPKLQSA